MTDTLYTIPQNWQWTTLENVADWGSGGTPSRKNPEYYTGNIAWIKTGELNNGYIYESEEHITIDALQNSSAKLYPKNSILIAMYGATIGKVGILGIEATTNQACACAICHSNTYFKYLFYYVLSQKENFIRKSKGGAQPNISQEIIKKFPIPIPPLAEQKRIVERIDSLFEKLDAAKKILQDIVDGYEQRRVAILHRAFTGELTEDFRKKNNLSLEDWQEKTLGEIGTLERGKSKHRPRNAAILFGGMVPFIQTGDIANSEKYITIHNKTLSDFGLNQSKLFPKGTLCITIAANIGDVAILSYDCCFPDSVVGFIPNENTITEYIYYIFKFSQKKLQAQAPATAQKNINLKILNNQKINLPPLEEQKEIARRLNSLLGKENQAKEIAEKILSEIEKLKKTILSRAFRGELGTNSLAENAVENFI